MCIRDRYSISRNELLDQLTYAMGGRVAEEIVFHDPTTGASNDIEKATSIARKMVTEYGMTNDVGPVKLGSSSGEVFMGRDMGHGRDFSERVDVQVRDLIEQAHNEAYEVINANRDVLDSHCGRGGRRLTSLKISASSRWSSVSFSRSSRASLSSTWRFALMTS